MTGVIVARSRGEKMGKSVTRLKRLGEKPTTVSWFESCHC